MSQYPFDVSQVTSLIKNAGKAVMNIYNEDFFAVYEKQDTSPVTDADLLAERIIYEGLKKITPEIPIIGEEHVAAGEMIDLSQSKYWLIDPIDGTADFVKKNGEFTINIALIENETPIFGAVYAPAKERLFYTLSPNESVEESENIIKPLKTRQPPADGMLMVTSRTHRDESVIDALVESKVISGRILCGSSLKFCMIASGEADIYPCSHKTKEWDTAAAHAVLKAAGGEVFTQNGDVLKYRKRGLENPCIISIGQPQLK